MKSPIVGTLMMAVIAGVSAGFAGFFYPWPEQVTQTDIVGEPLFEEYDYGSVRKLELVRFNRETNLVEELKFRRSGEKWVLPEKSNFEVTNSTAIADLVNSLNARTVLEVMSDSQQEHVEYGVVDPGDAEIGEAGLGTRITLSDRNDNEIASLIIGKSRKNDSSGLKRFVRVPDQAFVYSIDYDARKLSTEFANWTSANLLNIQNGQNVTGNRYARLKVAKYRVDPKDMEKGKTLAKYFAEIDFLGKDGVEIAKALRATDAGKMEPLEAHRGHLDQFSSVVRFLPSLRFFDVIKKDRDLIKSMRNPSEDADLSKLLKYGFRKSGFNNNDYQFESAGGTITVTMTNGLEISIQIGAPKDGELNKYTGRPERYMLLTAHVDQAFFPVPKKPETTDEQSDEYKAYLRKMEERKQNIKKAADVARAMNANFANWIYVVEETVTEGLTPDVNWDVEPPKTP